MAQKGSIRSQDDNELKQPHGSRCVAEYEGQEVRSLRCAARSTVRCRAPSSGAAGARGPLAPLPAPRPPPTPPTRPPTTVSFRRILGGWGNVIGHGLYFRQKVSQSRIFHIRNHTVRTTFVDYRSPNHRACLQSVRLSAPKASRARPFS